MHEISSETKIFLILFNNCTVNQKIVSENIGFCSTEPERFINTSLNQKSILKITNKCGKYDQNFLDQFYFYTEQLDAESIDNEIGSLLGVNGETVEVIVNFFLTWDKKDDYYITKLYKLNVKVKLLDILFGDFVPPRSLEKIDESMLNNIVSKFDATVIAQETSSVLMWNEIFHEIQNFYSDLSDWNQLIPQHVEEKLSSHVINSEAFAVYRGRTTVRLLYIFMIIQRKVPFFITTSNRLFASFIIKILPALNVYSVIFNVHKQSLTFSHTTKVFQNFRDMEEELYFNHSRKLMISFQNKTAIDLYGLIENCSMIKQEISVDSYIDLLTKKCVIGKVNDLPIYYINRHINVPVINSKVFNEDEYIFFIYNFPSKAKIKNHRCIDVIYLIQSYDELYEKPDHIITTSTEYSRVFTKFLERLFSNRTYFILKYINRHCFLLIQTNGSIEILKPYLTCHLVKDTDIMNIYKKCNINVICNNAGMGKSTFLSFINSKLLSNQWVIHMDLKKYSAKVKNLKTVGDLINFSYSCQTDDLSESFHTFLKPLYKHLREQIIWLIDDYEEVSEPGLLDLFKSASEEGFNIWIVARPYLKLEFESFFGVFSMQLAEFDKIDQTKFIQKYLKHKNKNENDIKVIMTAIKTIRHLLEDSFIGTCQQIMMLTEIFLNPENNLREHKWHVHDIFEKFINLKVDNDYGVRKEWYIRTVSKLALKVFFKDDALKNVFDLEEFNEDVCIFRNDYPKDFFITGFVENHLPIFSHMTYAEFLAARWILHTVKKQINGGTPFNMTNILRMLYLKELTTIRLFIDNMVTRQLPLHSAIVNNEGSKIMKLIDEIGHFSQTDFLGRSIFHLLSSYGSSFDTGIATDAKKLRNLDEHSEIIRDEENILLIPLELVKPPNESNANIIRHISENFFLECIIGILEKDALLEMDSVDYAMLSGSLLELDTLLYIRNNIANSSLSLSENIKLYLLFHSIKNRYNNILFTLDVKGLNNVKIGCSKMSFLHLAVTSRNLEAIKKLTKIHCLNENDWGVDSEGNTPLHIACIKNDDNILEYFFNQADLDVDFLNKKNLKGQSHLYFLARRDQEKWVRQIIQNFPGLHIDSECCNGNTPFIISVIFKNIDVARVLQSYGANINHYNSNNKSALHFAASKGFLNCVKQLIDWKVTVNCSDDYGKTPLMKASSWGHINIVKLLLANSAKIDERDCNQWTALHHAVRRNNVGIIRLLLKHKADVNCVNKKGESPVIIVCKRDLPKALKAIVSCGPKIDDLVLVINMSIQENKKKMYGYTFSKGDVKDILVFSLHFREK